MKSLPLPILLFFAFLALPIILWATATQQADIRSLAQDAGVTPTVTPSATPTVTPSATPTITPTPTNSPPRCSGLSVKPGAGAKPLTVSFACAGYDPDNDITAAEFGFGGSEKQLVEKGTGQFGSITTTHTYTEAGTYNVTCRVRDNNQVFSDYPSYCKYTVVVTDNNLTPTPRRTPTPTRAPGVTTTPGSDPILFVGGLIPTASPSPTIVVATATPVPAPQEQSWLRSDRSWWTSEKISQLVMMVIISGLTVVVALLLHGFFDKR